MFNRNLKMIALMILLSTGLIGCGDGEKLASVNGRDISKKQFESYLKFKRTKVEDEKRKQKLIDKYLEREALASIIENEKVLNQDLINAELNEFRKEMYISRYFEKFLKEKVSDQAIQNYYNTHASDYELKKVHAAHILIRTSKKMSETERKARLTTIQEAYSKLKKGMAFKEIAKEYSEDKISIKKGGDIGWIKKGSIDPVFSKTAFNLKPGEISEPFESKFGFHIVKLIDGPKTVKKPFKSVSGNIRYVLRNKTKKAEMERLLKKIRIKKN